MVTDDNGLRMVGMKPFKEQPQCLALCGGARVGRKPLPVKTAFITDTDTMTVVPLTVGTRFFRLAAGFYITVAANHEMIADTFPTTSLMPAVNVGRTALLPRTDSTAVDDNHRNRTHDGSRVI